MMVVWLSWPVKICNFDYEEFVKYVRGMEWTWSRAGLEFYWICLIWCDMRVYDALPFWIPCKPSVKLESDGACVLQIGWSGV